MSSDEKENSTERRKKLSWDGSINFGTMIQLIVLLITVTLAWGSFDKRTAIIEIQVQNLERTQRQADAVTQQQLEAANKAIGESNERTERIERYLISKDPKYLQQFGGATGKQ